MNHDDIDARTPAAVAPRRHSPWRWALGFGAAFALVFAGLLAALVAWLATLTGDGLSITVDGETLHLGALHVGTAVAAVACALLALLAVLCIVPVVVALALAAAALAVGVALFGALAAAALALSPLLLPLALLWWLLRRGKPRRAAAA